MPELFERIDPEKRQRVINAALDEFASKGCKQATTDNIIARAGISKGALYKYFGDKESMLIYLCDYVYEIVYKEYLDNLDGNSDDFFEMYNRSFKTKFAVVIKYPSLYDFITMLYTDGTERTNEWLSEKLVFSREQAASNLTSFDRSKFKDGLDIERAVNVVRLTFDSFTNELIVKLKKNSASISIDEVHKECDEFIAFFKKMLYKEEG